MSEISPEIEISDARQTDGHDCATTIAPDQFLTPPTIRAALVAAAGSNGRAAIISMLGRPVTWCLVRHWMQGRAKMPLWAITAVRARLGRLDAIVVASQGRKRGADGKRALGAYWAKRRAARDIDIL